MAQIILIIVGIAVVAVLLMKKTRALLRVKLRTGTERVVGICSSAFEQTAKKNERKAKILELLTAKGELSNSDIRDALGISRTSAVRYLDELEKEGKITQIGPAGHTVVYRLK